MEGVRCGMSTVPLIPVGEYLGSTYRPDVDFVDGRLEERNVGDFDHADVQSALGTYLRLRQGDWGVRVLFEVRVQVRTTRFRIPDLCVLEAGGERSPVVREAPLLCVEVLSPRDTVAEMRRRVMDYVEMGVRVAWIVDPATRTVFVCEGAEMTELRDGVLRVAGTAIEVPVGEIFSTLDA